MDKTNHFIVPTSVNFSKRLKFWKNKLYTVLNLWILKLFLFWNSVIGILDIKKPINYSKEKVLFLIKVKNVKTGLDPWLVRAGWSQTSTQQIPMASFVFTEF